MLIRGLLLVAQVTGAALANPNHDDAGSLSRGSSRACVAAEDGPARAWGAWSEGGGAGVVTGERLQVNSYLFPVNTANT